MVYGKVSSLRLTAGSLPAGQVSKVRLTSTTVKAGQVSGVRMRAADALAYGKVSGIRLRTSQLPPAGRISQLRMVAAPDPYSVEHGVYNGQIVPVNHWVVVNGVLTKIESVLQSLPGTQGPPTPPPAPPVIDPNALPTYDIADFTEIFADDMNYDIPVGGINPNQSAVVTGPLANRFTFYPDGWSTTHDGKIYAKSPSEPGYPGNWPAIVSKYKPTKTISFGGSMARFRHWSENGVAYGSTMKPIVPGGYKFGPFGRVVFRMRSMNVIGANGTDYSALNNYTTSPRNYRNWVPLAIDSANWGPYGIPNGEIDAPEGGIDRAWAGNWHPAVNPDRSTHISTALSPYVFHVSDWRWYPDRWEWWIDGTLVFTTTDHIPQLPLAFLFQFEADWRQPTGEGTIEVDWVKICSYTPGSPSTLPTAAVGASSLYDQAIYDLSTYGA